MKINWYTQSIHAAIQEHRNIRGRRRASAKLEEIYGKTLRFGPPEPLPPGLARELVRAASARNEALRKSRRERAARDAYRYLRLMEAQKGCCYICVQPFGEDRIPTKDHVWPQARGGKTARNVLWACLPCNGAKGDRLPTEQEMALLREFNQLLDEIPMRTPPTLRLVSNQ